MGRFHGVDAAATIGGQERTTFAIFDLDTSGMSLGVADDRVALLEGRELEAHVFGNSPHLEGAHVDVAIFHAAVAAHRATEAAT